MDVILKSLSQKANFTMRKNDVLANNLANVATKGFKRDAVYFKYTNNLDAELPAIQKTEFHQGNITPTNNPLDLAINGDGFFTIEIEGMENVLTRNGHFLIDENGLLKTVDGYDVLGESGPIELISKEGVVGLVEISTKGEINVNGKFKDKLRIVNTEDLQALKKIGGNMFSADESVEIEDVEEPHVQQGFLEGSNVVAITEMVELIQLQKQFEITQKVLHTVDGVDSKAATAVGKV